MDTDASGVQENRSATPAHSNQRACGMSEPSYRQAIADYIRANAKPADKFSHQPRLYQLATLLAENQSFDDDVLHAAAWMHDVGVFIGHRPENSAALAAWDHIAYAVKEVPKLLRQFGFPAEKIPAVIEVIRTHLPSTKPTSFERPATLVVAM